MIQMAGGSPVPQMMPMAGGSPFPRMMPMTAPTYDNSMMRTFGAFSSQKDGQVFLFQRAFLPLLYAIQLKYLLWVMQYEKRDISKDVKTNKT